VSGVSLDEHDTCEFVEAMRELIVSQAVDARTCANCAATSRPARAATAAAAAWRCLDCRHDLCEPCHAAHASLRLPARHRIVSVADLQTGRHQVRLTAGKTYVFKKVSRF